MATLNVFNQKLTACDQKSGIVYHLVKLEKSDPGLFRNPFDSQEQFFEHGLGDHWYGEYDSKTYQYVAQPWIILSNENSNKRKY